MTNGYIETTNDYIEITRELIEDVRNGKMTEDERDIYFTLRCYENIFPCDLFYLLEDVMPTMLSDFDGNVENVVNSLIEKKIIKLIEKDGLQDIEFLKYK